MKRIRAIGTGCIFSIMTIGFMVVLVTAVSYGLKLKGIQNNFISWFTQNASVDLSWTSCLKTNDDDKITEIQRYMHIVDGVEKTIEEFCTGAFPKNNKIKIIADVYKKDIMHNSLSATVGGKTDIEYAQEAANYVEEFNQYLTERGISFVYVQLPEKARILSCSQGTDYPIEELSLEDYFTKYMYESGIPYINVGDYTDEMSAFLLDKSNHWFPKDALTVTRIIARYLSKNKAFEFEENVFEADNYRDVFQDVDGLKEKIKEDCGYDYQLLVPIKSATYDVTVYGEKKYSGDFVNTLLVEKNMWDSRTGTNDVIAYHATWRLHNGNCVEIVNTSGTYNDGKKILILGDSFSWPISAYLSQGVEKVVSFHPRYYNVDVKTFIDEYQPDIVLWLYSEIQMGADNELNYGWVD